jgi:predicted transposase YbfD/YdcC
MENIRKIPEYFRDVETTEEHKGYFCSVWEALVITILGSFCCLRNVRLINQWACSPHVREFLLKYFGIKNIPCYYWQLCLLKLINPVSLNQCFMNWAQSLIPKTSKGYTVSFDGKTIRSTGKMGKYENPLHIVSAHIAELGITLGQQTVYDKSNEIPTVRELIELLNIEGCIVVADALNCQKETAKTVTDAGADYLLSVKDNHPELKQNIEDFVQDDDLRRDMDTFSTLENNRGRIERRIAFVSHDIDWLDGKDDWHCLACIGAVNTKFTTSKGTTDEWHYYISSRKLSAEELLCHARLEWSVESMHWLLDVHFGEDFCRVEDKNVQQNLNIFRKTVLNCIKFYKRNVDDKRPVSNIMFDCLLNPEKILSVLYNVEN